LSTRMVTIVSEKRCFLVEQATVKDIMVPLSEYATVSEDASMYEAVMALEASQKSYNRTQYTHRAVLVHDDKGRVVGKVSQLDVLRGLEPKYKEMTESKCISHTGFTGEFLRSIMQSQGLWVDPLAHICKKAAARKVREIMCPPEKNDYIKENATLTEAIHQFIMGGQQSLLVTRDNQVVGILRLSDAFAAVCDMIKTCRL